MTLAGLLIVIACLGMGMGLVRWTLADRPTDYVVAAIAGHDTIYSPSYIERRFRMLRVGMTAGEVEEVMGPPLRADRDPYSGQAIWFYSMPTVRGHNWWRRVVFFDHGRVSKIKRDFWLD